MKTENQLIALCSKPKINKQDEEKFNYIFRKDLDWKYLTENLNEKSKQRFDDFIQKKRIKDSLEVIDFLNKNKINYIVLKGLTLWYFNRKRGFGDLDILVDKKDVKNVTELLKNKLNYNYFNNYNELRLAKKYNFNIGKHIEMYKPNHIFIEVHYDLANSSLFNIKRLEILHNKYYFIINKTKIPSLTPELHLITIMIHNIGHLFLVDFEKWQNDTNLIINNRKINWNKFIEIINHQKWSALFYRAIKILNSINNKKVNISKKVIKNIYKNSSKIKLFLTKDFDINFPKKMLIIFKKTRDSKFYYTAWILWINLLFSFGFNKEFLKVLYYRGWVQNKETWIFPPKEEIAKTFKINPDSKIIYFYYPIRWFKSLLSIIKKTNNENTPSI